jgi:hypothetical protein
MILEKPTDDFVMPMWMRESGSTAFFFLIFFAAVSRHNKSMTLR